MAVVLIDNKISLVLVDLIWRSHDLYGSPERVRGPSDELELALNRQGELGRDVISSLLSRAAAQ